jgi:HD-like signal output (HDOD) protein
MSSLQEWILRLRDQEMPVLALTVQQIAQASEREDSSAAEVARIILQDPALTAKVLRLAGSSFFNPAGHPVNSLDRAVVVLGLNTVRALSISVAVINTLMNPPRERVMRDMARAFHGAVQARSFAQACQADDPEEVYVAALLYHLGRMAFWCFGGEQAARLDEALREAPEAAEHMEMRILGFRLSRLTAALNRDWRLSPLLGAALEGAGDARAHHVRQGIALAQASESGWSHAATRDLLARMAEESEMGLEEMTEQAHENARQAAQIAADYGAGDLGRLIPRPAASDGWADPLVARPGPPATDASPAPDPARELRILRELASTLEGQPDMNLVFGMVLEGLHRGLGLDRVLLALLSPDRQRLQTRSLLGRDAEALRGAFNLDVAANPGALVSRVLDTRRGLWLRDGDEARRLGIPGPILDPVVQARGCLMMTLAGRGRPIGLIYADRHPSRRPLDADAFAGFVHFCHQANLALAQVFRTAG